jgi:hypothetical protein
MVLKSEQQPSWMSSPSLMLWVAKAPVDLVVDLSSMVGEVGEATVAIYCPFLISIGVDHHQKQSHAGLKRCCDMLHKMVLIAPE